MGLFIMQILYINHNCLWQLIKSGVNIPLGSILKATHIYIIFVIFCCSNFSMVLIFHNIIT